MNKESFPEKEKSKSPEDLALQALFIEINKTKESSQKTNALYVLNKLIIELKDPIDRQNYITSDGFRARKDAPGFPESFEEQLAAIIGQLPSPSKIYRNYGNGDERPAGLDR
ncbi:MAG: hypothetical protein HYT93_03670 [Parcubacteria group bacterium]|nr:hypothetical protein [Parcubacteria group bacterium]